VVSLPQVCIAIVKPRRQIVRGLRNGADWGKPRTVGTTVFRRNIFEAADTTKLMTGTKRCAAIGGRRDGK